ncbi:phosphoglycerate mutase family 5 [Lachnospiraceae bacterium KM106-2]|nr:phosphoglycerate mutase family 5 [Lachnospiraceae bacterium KM106-2]
MKLIIVRHGDPDYENDTLTERGWKEANALVSRFLHMDVKDFYVSPLGRAKDTASCTLNALNRTATTLDWLKEFPAQVDISADPSFLEAYPDTRKEEDGSFSSHIVWDCMPSTWTKQQDFFNKDHWLDTNIISHSDTKEIYQTVIQEFDKLLSSHGYERHDNYYKAVRPNRDTIVLFCHFGLECVLLSHLMNVSPFVLWHSTAFAPTSVTTINTEEREKGIAYFRASSLGDISHLYAAGLEPSFACRFCETYDNWDERH